jgi:hypothetical protein
MSMYYYVDDALAVSMDPNLSCRRSISIFDEAKLGRGPIFIGSQNIKESYRTELKPGP